MPKLDAGAVQDARDAARGLLRALVEGGEVADEPEVLDGLLARVGDLEVQSLGPARAHTAGLAVGVALLGEVLQRVLQHRLHRALVDELAPPLHDRRHVLDADGAGLDAGHARRARPQHVVADDLAVLVALRAAEHDVAQVQDELARSEVRAARGRRACGRAAPALRAAVHVEHLLPGEHVGIARIDLAQRSARAQRPEEDVGDRRDDVKVLRQRQEVEERQDDEVVHPEAELADRRGRAGRDEGADQVGDRLPAALLLGPGLAGELDQARALVQEAAEHDPEDEKQDQDALPVVLAVQALLRGPVAEQAWGVGDEPPVQRVEHGHDDRHLDEVADQGVETPEQVSRAEQRQVEVLIVRPPEERQDGQHEDHEPPEDGRVHDPGGLLALEELLLPEGVDRGAPQPLPELVEARRGIGRQQQAGTRQHDRRERRRGDHERQAEQNRAHGSADRGLDLLGQGRAAGRTGRRSCRSGRRRRSGPRRRCCRR